jgi:hypothetical protein
MEVNTGVDVCDNAAHTRATETGTFTPVSTITATAGDTVTLWNYCNWPGPLTLDFIPNVGATVSASRYASGTMTLAAGTTSIQVKNMNNNAILLTFTVSLGGGVSAGESGGAAPWFQAIARTSATASCPAGYGGSWAQWPNDGRGGYVCNRTLVTLGGTSTWVAG